MPRKQPLWTSAFLGSVMSGQRPPKWLYVYLTLSPGGQTRVPDSCPSHGALRFWYPNWCWRPLTLLQESFVAVRAVVDLCGTQIRPLNRPKGAYMHHRLLTLGFIVLPLTLAAPALAAPTTTEVFTVENFTYVNEDMCGPDLDVTFTENGSFKITTFYDLQGSPFKTILTNFNERYTASATANGATLLTNNPLVAIQMENGNQLFMGLRVAFHVPGEGVVLLDAGRVVRDEFGNILFNAGTHQLEDGPVEAFCNFFFGS